MANFRADTVWEIRPDGSINNGGGFTPFYGGTDYSQQTSPVLSLTDLVGNSTTTVSSATGGFTAAMVGNTITIINQAIRQIVSVTDSNHIVVDTATGTFSGATGNVGGANTIDANGFNPIYRNSFDAGIVQAGQKLWVRATNASGVATTYNAGAASLSVSGGADQFITTEGYTSTRGDGGQATISFTGGLTVSGNYNIARNLKLTGVTVTGVTASGTSAVMENLTVVPGANAAGMIVNGTGCIARRCWVQAIPSNNGQSLAANGNSCLYEYCRFDGTVAGADIVALGSSAGMNTFRGCIFRNAAGNAVRTNNGSFAAQFLNCVFWNAAGAGLKLTQSFDLTGSLYVENCVFGKNATYDVDFTIENASGFPGAAELVKSIFRCNFFLTTGTARYHNLPANPNDTTLLVDPFIDSVNGNFMLNGTAGGGALISANPCTTTFADGVNSAANTSGLGGVPAPTDTVSMRNLWREYNNERSTAVVPDATVDIYLDGGLQELNRRLHYHYTTDTTSIALVAGQQEYSLPGDFIEMAWMQFGAFRVLEKGDTEQWRRRGDDWRNEPQGEPRYWAIYGNKLILRPAPSAEAVAANATLTFRYVSAPPSVTTNGAEQLSSQAWRPAVYWGTYQWCNAYPDSAVAQQRGAAFLQMFVDAVTAMADEYSRRAIAL